MIFKRLFQPKYQHKDPAVRIQALQDLNPEEAKEKSILHELAFNDSHVAVSLAALDKLNNFDLWWKMALTSKDQRVAKKSRSKVEASLLGKTATDLSVDNRRTFILECQDNAILDLLLKEQGIDQSDTELMLSVLSRLSKPQLNLRLLLETTNTSLQQRLFEQLSDLAEIGKVAKKARHPELVSLAQQKLVAIQEAKEKPIRLQKEVTMVLSKLLALADVKDYQKLRSDNEQLTLQYSQLQAQFEVLDSDASAEFNAKFDDFCARVNRKLDELAGEWELEQEAIKRSSLLQSAHETANAVIAKVNEALDTDAGSITLGELEQFSKGIEVASESLQQISNQAISGLDKRGIEALIQRLLQCRSSLDNLPALQTAIQHAEELTQTFAQLTPPTDFSQLEAAQQHVAELTAKWKELREPYADIWPTKVDKAWQGQKRAWTQAIKSLRNELDESIKRCRSKFGLILGQIKKGSFKNAMRHYEKLHAAYHALPESQQAKLRKQYDSVKEEIENLKDWQDYIATPRKPELLAEIEQLAQHPLDPEQQAAAVKRLRSEWNSLGKTSSENDELLNQTFDKTCEQAFKPCRDFYAEQDEIRDANFNAKMALLDNLDSLAQTGSGAELDKELSILRKKWKVIGEIDFKVKSQLDARYQAVVNPVKQRLHTWYQENIAQKETLISKVEDLLELDDLKAATSAAIALQNEWKTLNRADVKSERRLWEKFRAVNDALFAKRNEASQSYQAELEQRVSDITADVDAISKEVENAVNAADFQSLEQRMSDTRDALQTLPRKVTQNVWNKLKACRGLVQSKQNLLQEHQGAQQYRDIIDALHEWRSAEIPQAVSELSSYWRQAFHLTQFDDEDGIAALSRHELVVMMEIVKGANTNTEASADNSADNKESEQEMRKSLQLRLMTLKLQEGSNIELDALLRLFISKGAVTPADEPFLPRLAALFLPTTFDRH